MSEAATRSLIRRIAPADRRRFRRVTWTARVRGLTGRGEEFSCTTVDVCAGGVRLQLNGRLSSEDNLVLYVDGIGRVEGRIARVADATCAVKFSAPQRKIDKIADQLTWLINKDRLQLTDERDSERRPGGGHVVATGKDGRVMTCTVSDISFFGVALRTDDARPMIGERIRVGERTGSCVRYIEGGFAVDFRPTHPTGS